MKTLLVLSMLLALAGCTKKNRDSIDMKEFTENCRIIKEDTDAHSFNATAWPEDNKDTYYPTCQLDFLVKKDSTTTTFRVINLNLEQVYAIMFYKYSTEPQILIIKGPGGDK